MPVITENKTKCYHCGEECREGIIPFDEKTFCCEGCRLVYDVLRENNLCTYYQYNANPGISPKTKVEERFAYLDDEGVKRKLIQFGEGPVATTTFYIPQMHCSSCIWLLENLSRINPAVLRSRVNFLRREVSIVFRQDELSLRNLVEVMAMIGYEPLIQLNDLERKSAKKEDRSRIYKIGVAGFCFGNIMLFSFPEYFSLSDATNPGFSRIFSFINLALSLPVFFYCSTQFFVSAWKSLKQKFLNIDVPIALGILVMFVRSAIEILSGSGPGYMDTMAGLVFFMLLGRLFQDKTYQTLSFDRDYKSFFPVSVMVRRKTKETSIPISDLKVGDRLLIRNEELIPADAVLMEGEAAIDYSFVTGESVPLHKRKGELLYAGGRQKGTIIELEVVKEVSQSYLTQLWNNDAYLKKQDDSRFQLLVNRISHYFTFVILGISILSLGYWAFEGDVLRGWNAFTAVLIIACPCALAISSPFTLGNILRIFGRKRFYLKNYAIIEKLAKADTVVFDKTGTLTKNNAASILFEGEPLSGHEIRMIRSLVGQSFHPLSQLVTRFLPDVPGLPVRSFSERPGSGLEGEVEEVVVRVGSYGFTGNAGAQPAPDESAVYVSFNGVLRGRFLIRNTYRDGIRELAEWLAGRRYDVVVLTGDHEGERSNLERLFGKRARLSFNQSPADKLRAIQQLQQEGRNVLMIGDGLNDAGALKQSNVGIAVTDDVNNFSPACDGILDGSGFNGLGSILRTSKASHSIILGSFIIALLYNVIGCWFAVQGTLSPVIAAILMPISSVTIISFTTGMSNLAAGIKSK